MGDEALRAAIRARLASGMLPPAAGSRTFAGAAEGITCDGCGARIVGRQVQYEVDFIEGHSGMRVQTITLHRECHDIWIAESLAA